MLFRKAKKSKSSVKIVGRAMRYEPCLNCGAEGTQLPRGRGEIITRGGYYVARQYHVCPECGVKGQWHRRLDQTIWTMHRSGVQPC